VRPRSERWFAVKINWRGQVFFAKATKTLGFEIGVEHSAKLKRSRMERGGLRQAQARDSFFALLGQRLRDMVFSLPFAHPDLDRGYRSLFLALLGGKIPFSSYPMFC